MKLNILYTQFGVVLD